VARENPQANPRQNRGVFWKRPYGSSIQSRPVSMTDEGKYDGQSHGVADALWVDIRGTEEHLRPNAAEYPDGNHRKTPPPGCSPRKTPDGRPRVEALTQPTEAAT
jgi:hypothetical protein